MDEPTPFLPGLSPVGAKPFTTNRDAGNLSSNGGLLVLREAALRLGIAEAVAQTLPDRRNPLLITHGYAEMVQARMMMIAAGYEDCDDIDRLKIDPVLKMACGRCPETGDDLMSQPTLSRLENLAGTRELITMGRAMIDLFCRGYGTAPHSIDLDIDDTDDMVHGGQQLALFNTHSGGYCFKPMYIFEAASGKPVLALLRPGKRPAGTEIARVLRHVILRIRKHWPKVRILIRGDGHYGVPEVFTLLRKMGCGYILGLAKNAVLEALSAPWREQCKCRWKPSRRRSGGSTSSLTRPRPGTGKRRSSRATRQPPRAPTPATSSPTWRAAASISTSASIAHVHAKHGSAMTKDGKHDQGHEALHALGQDRVPPLAG